MSAEKIECLQQLRELFADGKVYVPKYQAEIPFRYVGDREFAISLALKTWRAKGTRIM